MKQPASPTSCKHCEGPLTEEVSVQPNSYLYGYCGESCMDAHEHFAHQQRGEAFDVYCPICAEEAS